VLKKSLYAYTIYSAALTPVILAAFFWRRATAAGAVSSIAAGTVVTIGWEYLTPHLPPVIAARDAILPALVASLVCLFVVSLLTPRPSEAQLAPFAA
jgi:SSS family solute:Na+ symporter/sodium/proline symporter